MSQPAAPVPFPWREVMAFGLGRLGWPPDAFWAATPREIGAALRAHQRADADAAPGREALHALMAAHPDA
ncbi:phage tail assembly chaperone [Bosea sp. (in: a-proteobacteria)]|uniref:phage tail assembly chaperone n=1 Tax=Bosea sp. (in: a-proteobacteria) TaxID=1871050 RepID=UPI003561C0E0